MHRNQPAGVVRRGNRRRHFGLREGWSAVFPGAPAVVAVQLNHVRTGRDLAANGGDDPFDATSLLGSLRDRDTGFEAFGTISTLGHDGPRRDEQMRTRNDALVDRLAQPDVGVAGSLGSEVTFGGEAGKQGRASVHHRPRRPQRQRLVQHLRIPLCLIVRVEEQVAMTLDHAGNEGCAGQVDDPRAGRYGQRRSDRLDPVAADQYLPPAMRRGADGIEHRIWPQQQARLHLRRRGTRARQNHEHEEQFAKHSPTPSGGAGMCSPRTISKWAEQFDAHYCGVSYQGQSA